MLAEVVRSGRVEACHDGVVVVADRTGRVVAVDGDGDRPFLGRSAFKPFQALASLRAGAGLDGPALALACASHAGLPEQLAVVRSMLSEAGLSERDLRTPPDWPLSPVGLVALAREGVDRPSALFHNCSGKHAATLAACVASDLDITSYLRPDHPLQRSVAELVAEATRSVLPEPAVDGCGLPAHETTATGLATAFARLAVDDAFAPIRAAMVAHPVLIGDHDRVDSVLAGFGHPAKIGAEGCVGIALPALGLGVAVKAWDGAQRPLAPAAAAVLEHLGVLTDDLRAALAVPVLGGGRPVGEVRSMVSLRSPGPTR